MHAIDRNEHFQRWADTLRDPEYGETALTGIYFLQGFGSDVERPLDVGVDGKFFQLGHVFNGGGDGIKVIGIGFGWGPR